MHEGIQRLGRGNRRKRGLCQLNGRGFASPQSIAGTGQRKFHQIRHYSTTIGTAKNPSRASGALASTAAC